MDEVHDKLDRDHHPRRGRPRRCRCRRPAWSTGPSCWGCSTSSTLLLPETITQAQEVLGDKEGVVEEGRREAEQIIAAARAERRRLLEQTEVFAEASHEADRLLEEARSSADLMRTEVEDYVDAKLANFEIVLNKTLAAVERGRQKLSGRHELEALGDGAAHGDTADGDDGFFDEPAPE